MESLYKIRRAYKERAGSFLLWAACLFCVPACLASPFSSRFPRGRSAQVAPIERRPPQANRLPATRSTGGYRLQTGPGAAPIERRSPARGEHLAEWMNQHSNLTPEQQQQALQREPGFKSLPPQTQQRYLNRLAQLNAMNPQRRERVLQLNEWMEHLAPQQRADVRGAMGQLGSLPPDQRTVVARTFGALRGLPPQQRIPALNSGRFGPPMNDAQRAALYNLLRVEPLLPPPNRP